MRTTSPLSLTARLTLIFASGFTAILIGLGWLIASAIDRHFQEQDIEVLTAKLALAQRVFDRVRSPEDVDRFPSWLAEGLVGHHDLAVQVLSPEGDVLLDSSEMAFPSDWMHTTATEGAAQFFEWQTSDGKSYRAMASPVWTAIPTSTPYLVAVATDIEHHISFMRKFRQSLWLFVAGAALLTAVVAWAAAKSGLHPIRVLEGRLAAVTARRLNNRLALKDAPAELGALVETLNNMLERLDEAFKRLSDFSSDIAHELRTPINSLMTQTHVALSRDRDAAAYCEVLVSNAEELERLGRMVSDMLFLAKAEHGLSLASCETIVLQEELYELFDFYGALAEERCVKLSLVGDASLLGDKLMLRRAMSNLLSNALRYTPHGREVTVRLTSSSDTVSVCVDNPGTSIPERDLPRIFERFYRGDPARSHVHGEGTGLGLAIVKAIVSAHQGEVTVSSESGITRFTMRFPRRISP